MNKSSYWKDGKFRGFAIHEKGDKSISTEIYETPEGKFMTATLEENPQKGGPYEPRELVHRILDYNLDGGPVSEEDLRLERKQFVGTWYHKAESKTIPVNIYETPEGQFETVTIEEEPREGGPYKPREFVYRFLDSNFLGEKEFTAEDL